VIFGVAVIVGVQVGGRNLENVGVGETGIFDAGEQPTIKEIIKILII